MSRSIGQWMNRRKSIFFVLIILNIVQACSSTSKYNIKIERNLKIGERIKKNASQVYSNFPSDLQVNNHNLETYMFQNYVQNTNIFNVEPINFENIYSEIILKGPISYSFFSKYEDRKVMHEVSAGFIEIPYSKFVEMFDPEKNWGKYLSKYLGGELVVDKVNKNNKSILQRERMVLGMPWYTIGTPNLDMEKYEWIEYEKNSTQIYWEVINSENKSVFLDIGYLRFQSKIIGDKEYTMVIFNSMHRINEGWFSAIMPSLLTDSISLKSLRDVFCAHITSYKKIILKLYK